ncbi:MAG TPA: DNA methyltransferase [Gemmatimonadaceae bacterium]|nr:DNA methyltransferase [Gemmatimonadaceae bacterium]
MLTARAAATLLADAADSGATAPLLDALGFAPPTPLDAAARASLGVPPACDRALVARGSGALRALVIDLPPAPGGPAAANGHAVRESVARLATRLATRTPHLCWLVVAVERDGPHTVLAAWASRDSGDGSARRPPRVAALVVDRRHVVDSDAETLRSLAALSRPPRDPSATPSTDLLTHTRWLEVLGRDSLTRAFYRALERTVGHMADALEIPADARRRVTTADRRDLALLYASRLVFLSFLEAKGWLDGDRAFIAHAFERATASGRPFHQRVLLPLFFGTLNTPQRRRAAAARAFGRIPFLNGGLFARTSLERRCGGAHAQFPDEALGTLLGDLLHRYRFTAREDSVAWSEAAIDPEMLGRAFESLMSTTDRRSTGTFYTPHAIVHDVVEHALRHALHAPGVSPEAVDAALAGQPVAHAAREALRGRLDALRVLDPACGSGAFLVHALERLASVAASLGDTSPLPEMRRAVLARSIFGVDLDPTAVWLCELRLWLSVVIESDETDPRRVPPLPNLDRNVRVGDSLGGDAFPAPAALRTTAATGHAAGRRVATLRERYARASGPRKRTLAAALDREERRCALAAVDAARDAANSERRELLVALRTPDLFGERHLPDAALRDRLADLRRTTRALTLRHRQLAAGAALPFSFTASFADVAAVGGFDAIVGNPPWVRLHHIAPAARATLKRDYVVFRAAAWTRGAEGAHAGRGFSAQVDLSALFVERSVALLGPSGVVALVLPAKLWRSLAGGGLRAHLSARTRLLALEDWSEAHAAFDAATYPSLLVARRDAAATDRPTPDELPLTAPSAAPPPAALDAAVRRGDSVSRWRMPHDALPLDASPGSPWLLLPPRVRRAFDALTAAGPPLARSAIGRPHLGVKSGCNEAFLVRVVAPDVADLASVADAAGRRACVERSMLRPLVRGESVARWRQPPSDARILWPANDAGRALARLPPHAARWLAPWQTRLAARADARSARRWWSLFRPDAADTSRPRVVWADLAHAPRAAVLPRGDPTVPLNSCYVVHCSSDDDAFAFAALFNSSVAAAWLHAVAEPARGGYHRYLGWTVALLPLPARWPRARALLAPLGRRGFLGGPPSDEELDASAVAAYGLRHADLAPLLDWLAPNTRSAIAPAVADPRPATACTGT